jgi:hypothetical protein
MRAWTGEGKQENNTGPSGRLAQLEVGQAGKMMDLISSLPCEEGTSLPSVKKVISSLW